MIKRRYGETERGLFKSAVGALRKQKKTVKKGNDGGMIGGPATKRDSLLEILKRCEELTQSLWHNHAVVRKCMVARGNERK